MSRRRNAAAERASLRAAVLRAGWACCVLAARRALAGPGSTPATVMALLGARHLAQAVLVIRRPGGLTARYGGAADLVHAVTMLAPAVRHRDRRLVALTDACAEALLAAVSIRAAQKT
jgi:hypothetical protein